MKITGCEKNKKKRERIDIYIDGKYSFSVPEEEYLRLSLYDLRELTDDEINYIKNEVNLRDAKNKAISYMASRLRCENEVRQKLTDYGYDEDTVESAIEELKSMGYINDKMYILKFAYDRSKLKPMSKKMIKYLIVQKGVDKDLVNQVLEDWEQDENATAFALIKRKFGKYDLNDEKYFKKAYMFLLQRGFSNEIINKTINDLKNERK